VEYGSPRAKIPSKSKSESRIHVHDAGHPTHAAKYTSAPCAKKKRPQQHCHFTCNQERDSNSRKLSSSQKKKKKKKKNGAKRKILADLVGCKDREEEGLEVERQVGATATATATAPHHEHVWTYLIFEIEPGLSSPIVPEGVPIII
jgi:hypothetical protein